MDYHHLSKITQLGKKKTNIANDLILHVQLC